LATSRRYDSCALLANENNEAVAMKSAREKVSIKGVVIGSISDIVGSNVWGVVLVAYLMSRYDSASIPQSQLETAISSIVRSDPLLFAANLLIGASFSVLGGYMSAHIAKRNERRLNRPSPTARKKPQLSGAPVAPRTSLRSSQRSRSSSHTPSSSEGSRFNSARSRESDRAHS